jgi:predicted Zn-dependent protease
MSDPATTATHPEPDAGPVENGDARVEHLLLSGLDHYFTGRFEQAVHVWTRVLFLDRGHARARAYIERARSAIAERQRHSDELLHRGTAAFEDGQVASARRLLTAAVEQGGAADVALAYLDRLDRLSGASAPPPEPAAPAVPVLPAVHRAPHPTSRAGTSAAWMLAAVVGLLALVWVADAIRELAGRSVPSSRAGAAADASVEPLPMVRASDVALARARALFDTGHAADAIRLLATISRADPNRPDADRLLADIQRALLRAASPSLEPTARPVR